jgi:hypothetical protein
MSSVALRWVVLVFLMLGCGGDDVDCKKVEAMAAPPTDAQLLSLSPDQRAQLCDLAACQNGGYGAQRTCQSGPSVTFAGSRGQCLNQFPMNPSCHATVKDLMGCMEAIRASPCTSTFLGSSACEAVTDFDCVTFTPHEQASAMAAAAR